MKYRSMGRTGLKVSEIGFGCGGNAGLMVRGGFDQQLRIVEAALEAGINYFDVAPDYIGAEANLGRVLRSLSARPLINSKVEIRAENLDDIAGHVVRSAESSLKALGVDRLDVLQIHNAPVAGARAPVDRDYHTLGVQHFLGRAARSKACGVSSMRARLRTWASSVAATMGLMCANCSKVNHSAC